jgi:hypothetical protein
VIRARLRQREITADRYSDAGEAVAAALRRSADPWPQAHEIDTGHDVDVSVREAGLAAGLTPAPDLR